MKICSVESSSSVLGGWVEGGLLDQVEIRPHLKLKLILTWGWAWQDICDGRITHGRTKQSENSGTESRVLALPTVEMLIAGLEPEGVNKSCMVSPWSSVPGWTLTIVSNIPICYFWNFTFLSGGASTPFIGIFFLIFSWISAEMWVTLSTTTSG